MPLIMETTDDVRFGNLGISRVYLVMRFLRRQPRADRRCAAAPFVGPAKRRLRSNGNFVRLAELDLFVRHELVEWLIHVELFIPYCFHQLSEAQMVDRDIKDHLTVVEHDELLVVAIDVLIPPAEVVLSI